MMKFFYDKAHGNIKEDTDNKDSSYSDLSLLDRPEDRAASMAEHRLTPPACRSSQPFFPHPHCVQSLATSQGADAVSLAAIHLFSFCGPSCWGQDRGKEKKSGGLVFNSARSLT